MRVRVRVRARVRVRVRVGLISACEQRCQAERAATIQPRCRDCVGGADGGCALSGVRCVGKSQQPRRRRRVVVSHGAVERAWREKRRHQPGGFDPAWMTALH